MIHYHGTPIGGTRQGVVEFLAGRDALVPFPRPEDRLQRLTFAWPIVALGSSGNWPNPGTEKWWERTAEAMSVICDEEGRPRCKLHGLRMLDEDILRRLPLASADSTNVARNAASRAYKTSSTSQARWVKATQIESVQSVPVFTANAKQTKLFS